MIGPLLATKCTGDLAAAAIATILVASNQTQNLWSSRSNKLPQAPANFFSSTNFKAYLCFPQISWNTFWATRRWTSETKRRSWSSSRRLIRASGSASSRIRRRFRISWKAVRLRVLVRRRNTGKGFRRWRGSRTRSEFEAKESFRSTTIPVSINLLQCIVVNFFSKSKTCSAVSFSETNLSSRHPESRAIKWTVPISFY